MKKAIYGILHHIYKDLLFGFLKNQEIQEKTESFLNKPAKNEGFSKVGAKTFKKEGKLSLLYIFDVHD